MNLLVVGIGQSFRGDDGSGIAAVKFWRDSYKSAQDPQIRIEIAELPGLALLDLLENSQAAIIVDAMRSGNTPGTIRLLSEDDIASFGKGIGSAHGWGVAETLTLARQLELQKLPDRISIIAIESGQFEIGGHLSREVQNAIPAAARLIEDQIQQILKA
jgi:hydrogenase maturation protease